MREEGSSVGEVYRLSQLTSCQWKVHLHSYKSCSIIIWLEFAFKGLHRQAGLCLNMQFTPYLLLVQMHLSFLKSNVMLLATSLVGAAQRYGLLVHVTKFRQNTRALLCCRRTLKNVESACQWHFRQNTYLTFFHGSKTTKEIIISLEHERSDSWNLLIKPW